MTQPIPLDFDEIVEVADQEILGHFARYADGELVVLDKHLRPITGPGEVHPLGPHPAAVPAEKHVLLRRELEIERARSAALRDAILRVRAELDHAGVNDHHLAGQGVGPGEIVPAVRVSNIEAALKDRP